MYKDEFENIKAYFMELQERMKERDDDCAEPKNAIDKGYSLAVSHMNDEIADILKDLEKINVLNYNLEREKTI